MQYRIEQVPAPVVYALRGAILRPSMSEEGLAFPGDDDPETVTFAAIDGAGEVVGTGRVAPAPGPGVLADRSPSWQLRGMAVREDLRNAGLGRAILERCLAQVAASGGGVLWCNARTPARSLYARAGFVTEGDEFEIEDVGPHYVMWREVAPG